MTFLILLFQVHHFTCLISVQLCSPWWNWILALTDTMYDVVDYKHVDYLVPQECDAKLMATKVFYPSTRLTCLES